MGIRRRGREVALQALYLSDVCKISADSALERILAADPPEKAISDFAAGLVNGVAAKKEALDALIVKYAQNWELKRMAALDRNILRIGGYELLHSPDTPVSVVIDEAVEIAKTFSTDDSGKFVNGILDKIKNDRQAPTA